MHVKGFVTKSHFTQKSERQTGAIIASNALIGIAKKLQADAEATRRQLEQEKQTVSKVKVQAATTQQQLEQEREREVEEAQGRC